jgi:hypothetical protein
LRADCTRAVILTTERTGSTFLFQCLDSHPEVHCAAELLNGQPDFPIPPPRGPFRYIIKGFRIARTGAWLPHYRLEKFYNAATTPVRCFKVMYGQFVRPFALRYLLQHREIRVIHLRRENLLQTHVSVALMQKRRDLHVTQPVAPVWAHIDPGLAIAAMRQTEALYQRYDRLFAGHPLMHVSYETMIDGSRLDAATGERICDFLGVSRQPMQSPLVKLNPRSLRDMVSNYDQLAEAVSRSEFAGMLS